MSRKPLIESFDEQAVIPDSSEKLRKSRALASFLGNSVGDAVGAPFEFKFPVSARAASSVPGHLPMQETLNFRLQPGQYTDDFAQALCLTDVLLKYGQFMPTSFLDNLIQWWGDDKLFSSGGRSIGLGANIGAAIYNRYLEREAVPVLNGENKAEELKNREAVNAILHKPTHFTKTPGYQCAARGGCYSPWHKKTMNAGLLDGNGSTMRASPAAVFANSIESAMLIAAQQSHATTEGVQAADCARLIAYLSYRAIHEERFPNETDVQFRDRLLSPESMKQFVDIAKRQRIFSDVEPSLDLQLEKMVLRVPQVDYRRSGFDPDGGRPWFDWWKDDSSALSGDTYFGSYAMDNIAILLHALHTTDSFEEAVTQTARRCGDADSNAAVVGTVAGAIYGLRAIPRDWVEAVGRHAIQGESSNIVELGSDLYELGRRLLSQPKEAVVAATVAAASASDSSHARDTVQPKAAGRDDNAEAALLQSQDREQKMVETAAQGAAAAVEHPRQATIEKRNSILDVLDQLKKLEATPSVETSEKIARIIARCNAAFYRQAIYGNAALNRRMLLDEELSELLTPDVIRCIFSESNADNYRIDREGKKIRLADAIYFGFSDGLKTVKYMPNNEEVYSSAVYQEQKQNFDRFTVAIIRNIFNAQPTVAVQADFEVEEFNFRGLDNRFKAVSRIIDTIKQKGKSDELLHVPGYSPETIRNQAKGGFRDACDVLGMHVSPANTEVDKNFSHFCDLFLKNESVMLNGSVSHMFYDRAHLEAAIEQDTKIKFNDREAVTFKEIFSEMMRLVSENPDAYPDAAKEQLLLRLELVENDLRKRFPVFFYKEAGFPIEDNAVAAIRSHDDGSFDVVGYNNANEERLLHITPNGVFENHYNDKTLGFVHRQMANHLNKIFDHFHVDRTPEQKVVFALREAIADYEFRIAAASTLSRMTMWSSSDSRQIIDTLKQILEAAEDILADKVTKIRDKLSTAALLERKPGDRLPDCLVKAGLVTVGEDGKMKLSSMLTPVAGFEAPRNT